MDDFTESVIRIIKRIPPGKVATYGQIALLAGQLRGARQVTRILHTMSRKYDLPWHRIINARGCISLPRAGGYEEQKASLQLEGIEFDKNDRIDFTTYLWRGDDRCKSSQREGFGNQR